VVTGRDEACLKLARPGSTITISPTFSREHSMRTSARAAAIAFVLATAPAFPVFAEGGSAAPPRRAEAPAAASTAQVQATAEARRLSDAFVAVAEHANPSVVQVEVTARDEKADALAQLLGRTGGDEPVARGMGSGIVFTADGAILTNNHVVESALTLNVRLGDGRYLPAHLVGRDPATDLAVLKVDATGLAPARFADSDAARVGEWVVAIGSPFGLNYTVTAGVLSAKGRGGLGMNAIEDYLQTDASINPGNSGGPLCNLQGDVVGVNTMVVGRGQGIGFAVPSNLAQRVAGQILRNGRVSRAWLGVGVQDVTPEIGAAIHVAPGTGALVNNVVATGPAYRANLRPGDVIAAVAGHPVHQAHDVVRETIEHDVGQPLALEILRGGVRYGTTVMLTERPERPVDPIPAQVQAPPHLGLGLIVRDVPAAQAERMGLPSRAAVVVVEVKAGSSADRQGVKAGDVIVEANGVADPTAEKIAEMAKGGTLMVRIRRGENYFYSALSK
jgi:S1-C subfamily serine protease